MTTTNLKIGDRVEFIADYSSNAKRGQTGVVKFAPLRVSSDSLIDIVMDGTLASVGCYARRVRKVAPVEEAPAPAAIDLNSLKEGDKVTFTMTVEVTGGPDFEGDVPCKMPNGETGYLWRRETYVGTVEKAATPIKVGDKVNVLLNRAGGTVVADRKRTVLAIYGGEALLDVDGSFSEKRRLTQLVPA